MPDLKSQQSNESAGVNESPTSREAAPGELSASARLVLQAARTEFFAGPLPHPDDLLRYKEVFPECPERIVQLAEAQAAHRRDIEKKKLRSGIFTERLAMILAFCLAAAAVLGGIFLVANDKQLTGFATFFSSIVVLAGLFLRESRRGEKRREDRSRKLQASENKASTATSERTGTEAQ